MALLLFPFRLIWIVLVAILRSLLVAGLVTAALAGLAWWFLW
jgi:hypothetical protein